MTLEFAALPGTAVLAQQQPGGGQGADFGKSSPLGLLILVLFLIAVALLVRSMTKHLRRIPASFGDDQDEAEGTDAAEPGAAEPGAADPDVAEGAERPAEAGEGEAGSRDGRHGGHGDGSAGREAARRDAEGTG